MTLQPYRCNLLTHSTKKNAKMCGMCDKFSIFAEQTTKQTTKK